jgi:hypothetical protein
MSIFSKKNKAEKSSGGKKVKTEKKSQDDEAVEKGASETPYVPKHAASDSVTKSPFVAGVGQKTAARFSTDSRGLTTGNAAYMQALAHNARHNTPPPSSLAGQQLRNSMSLNNSAEVFTTDPDAPPLPPTPSHRFPKVPTPKGSARNSIDYFSLQKVQSQPLEAPTHRKEKLGVATQDRGQTNAHYSDSGYGSVIHSRAPSEQGDASGTQLPRTNSGFLPELSLGGGPMFSERVFNNEPEIVNVAPKKAREGVLKTSKTYFGTNSDARSLRSTTSVKAKQTRFENAPAVYRPEIPQGGRDGCPGPTGVANTQPLKTQNDQQESATTRRAIPERESLLVLPEGVATSPSTTTQQTFVPRPHRHSSPVSQAFFGHVERVVSDIALPPLRILDGFKVNKRGQILDEEGDPIGELHEGDIIDCE